MNNYKSGKWAEFLACCYLRLHGYRLVARNVIVGRGSTAGEIDIIARKHRCLIFIEVKKRQTLDKAAYAITAKQQQRITRGAQHFLQKHRQYQGFDLRFDAVLIKLPFSVCHILNAWTI